jgi:glycosyltransferase involved in cell wall biosynthesis
VYLSAIAWAGVRNRQHELALQAAVTRCVLFVEPPTLRPSWRLRVDRPAPALWRAAPLALLPFGRLIPWANAINRSYSGLRLRRWLDRHAGERLVVVDEDLAAPLAGRLGARARLYDAADLDWTFTRAWNRRHLRRALGAAVAGADAVTTSSPVLADHLPACRAPVIELLNACDASHFAGEPPVPAALAALPGPRIGYVGAVDRRAFDAELVAAVARARPAWTFVLAGPVDPRVGACFAGVANVHLLGPVPYDRLPALLGACDVCLVPYRVGGRIDYVQPKKLLEYLAAGKPVVTTDLPALRTAGLPVRRASGPAAFAAAIAAELDHGPDAQMVAERRRCARRHTWDARGRTLRAVLDRLEAAR